MMLARAATTSKAAAPSTKVSPQSNTAWTARFTQPHSPSPVGLAQMASVQAWWWAPS